MDAYKQKSAKKKTATHKYNSLLSSSISFDY